MRRTIVTFAILGSLITPTTAAATDNGTVEAQVTVAAPCITVGAGLDYGTMRFSTATGTGTSYSVGGRTTSYSNCSSQSQLIYARGTNAQSSTSDAIWELTRNTVSCPTDLNKYRVTAQTDEPIVSLEHTDQLIDSAAAAGVTQTVTAGLTMPCSGSLGAGETMTYAIIVTATF